MTDNVVPFPAPAQTPEPLLRTVIGEVLRDERKAQERTLRDVSDDAGISIQFLSEIERGRKEASSELLGAVSTALGLSLGSLLRRAERSIRAAHSRPATVIRLGTPSVDRGPVTPGPQRRTPPLDSLLLAA